MGPPRYDHPKGVVGSQLLVVGFDYEPRTSNHEPNRILMGNKLRSSIPLPYGRGSVCRVNFMVKPNGLLVTVSSTYSYAYTSVLSTWSSSTALIRIFSLGDLILRKVSRLYAFSVYPDPTSLPSYATGVTTGSQEVGSSRSSRTKDKPSQISCAHIR